VKTEPRGRERVTGGEGEKEIGGEEVAIEVPAGFVVVCGGGDSGQRLW
jgi:hypothetical protein